MKSPVRNSAALVIGSLALFVFTPSANPQSPAPVHPSSILPRVPLYFEANRGQTAPEVRFLARAAGYDVFLTTTAAVIMRPASTPLRMIFIGANPEPRVSGLDQLPGKTNYLRGALPSAWLTNVPTYARVAYRDLYPGVDLVYHADHQRLEYDFIVAPGADPRTIALGFEGAQRIELTADGDLALHTDSGTIRHLRPMVYQQSGETRQIIDSRYVMRGAHEAAFELGQYDATRPVVIDPTLAFSTYLGGSASDLGMRVAVDAAGDVFIAGNTDSPDFPVVNSTPAGTEHDNFVTKISGDGSTLLYSTFFGGSGVDGILDMTLDSAGRVFVSGTTSSLDFPTRNAMQPTFGGGELDGFVVQLDVAGDAFVYATYLGGRQNDYAFGIAVDSLGAACVTGKTLSPDFPTLNAFKRKLHGADAFVTKLGGDGAMVFSTYLGGADQLGEDAGGQIAVDGDGYIYVAGLTGSRNFPTRSAFQKPLNGTADAFLTKFTPDGSRLVYSTFFGGSAHDAARALVVDASNRPVISGETFSTDLPATSSIQPTGGGIRSDVFVAQFTADGSRLVFSTYLGGSDAETAADLALDGAGNIWVVGETQSLDFPVANNPIQAVSNGSVEAFFTKIAANGTGLLYSTYYGGHEQDAAVGVAVDQAGNIYMTGATNSADFRTEHALQPTISSFGIGDAFLVKFTP
jgi:hypothetical protein